MNLLDRVDVDGGESALSRRIESGGIRGVRKDQYAMIGVTAGTVVLPPLEVPWWNTQESEWQVARLPERTIKDTRRITAVEGTQVKYEFHLNKAVQTAELIGRDSVEVHARTLEDPEWSGRGRTAAWT